MQTKTKTFFKSCLQEQILGFACRTFQCMSAYSSWVFQELRSKVTCKQSWSLFKNLLFLASARMQSSLLGFSGFCEISRAMWHANTFGSWLVTFFKHLLFLAGSLRQLTNTSVSETQRHATETGSNEGHLSNVQVRLGFPALGLKIRGQTPKSLKIDVSHCNQYLSRNPLVKFEGNMSTYYL